MTHESLLNRDWDRIVHWLGGAAALERSARETRAFVQAREIKNAIDLLRLVLAYCLGEQGFRSTTAWAVSMELVDISAPALLYRLRRCGDWLTFLIEHVLRSVAPEGSQYHVTSRGSWVAWWLSDFCRLNSSRISSSPWTSSRRWPARWA